MKVRRFWLLAAFLSAAILPGLRAQVRASLVSAVDTVSPGRPFTVALRLVHQPEWHTYWINPGTGLPTSLKWTLPAGWSAGGIQWPAPEVLKDATGAVSGNGYEGDLLLPVTITPPPDAPPGPVQLKAAAEWLMCRDVCKPGKAELSLALAVTASSPTPDPSWASRIKEVVSTLPGPVLGWTVTATRDAKTVTLTVMRNLSVPDLPTPTDLHFFADDDLVAFDQPQTVADDGHGGFVLTLPIAIDAPPNATKLLGVLTSETGWLPGNFLRGLRVDVPFAAAGALPAASVAGPSPSASPSASAEPAAGLAGTLLLAFVGGLILNLMPCVFPVIGIKILGFVNQAGQERGKVVAHGLSFSSGVLLSFWALAGLLAVLRAGGAQLGWGFQLQSPAFVFGLAAVMLVFALNMSGVFEFGLSATRIGSDLQTKSGLLGSFFTGMLATVVATPCSAPFLAPALGAALALSTAASFLIFTAIAVGLSTPYLLLSAFPAAVKILPRPGEWMVTFRQLLAFPLYGTVGYLAWVLAGQVSENDLLTVFVGLVLIAMGAWAYGRSQAAAARHGRGRLGALLAVALLVLGAWTGWPNPPRATDIVWDKWSPESVAQLQAAHRIVYVDFTARWCATCQANKKLVFHSADVLSAFHDKNIATLRGDWTNQDPAITAELAKYHRSAVPFNLVWLPGRTDPIILPSLLTPRIVLDAVGG